MAKYIEIDNAVKTAIEICVKVKGQGITQFDAVEIADAMEGIPTADVVEVKHGWWISHYDDLFPVESTQECSICHEEEFISLCNENYCPNCGAKMDGERKDA